ncbi:hypothetical protein LJR234_004637 [Mesorhizobium amorphae]|uniref:hypothetical protein n=1 Tax=Mesorhizobium amorphae TaxID=71433 RepID=UPI003ECDB4B7
MADLVADANAARPVAAGGSGSATAVGGNDNFNLYGADMASAATLNLANATGSIINVTGTVTITAMGTLAAGAERELVFQGILTLTYNATSLILPGSANITTAAGDVARMRSLGGGNWRCVGYQRASGQSVTNIITSPNIVGATTINGTATGDLLTLITTDATSGAGPTINSFRNSASPAANDFIGQLNFTGKNSAGGTIQYSGIAGQIIDPTAGSEDSVLFSATYIAGAIGIRWYTGAGFYMAGSTGGDAGAGTINSTGFFRHGTALPFQTAFESAQQTITSGGSLTLAHGLGAQPKLYLAVLQCTTANIGYSIGDEVALNPGAGSQDLALTQGISIVPDATNINVRFGTSSPPFRIVRKDTGAFADITSASWRLVARAWR